MIWLLSRNASLKLSKRSTDRMRIESENSFNNHAVASVSYKKRDTGFVWLDFFPQCSPDLSSCSFSDPHTGQLGDIMRENIKGAHRATKTGQILELQVSTQYHSRAWWILNHLKQTAAINQKCRKVYLLSPGFTETDLSCKKPSRTLAQLTTFLLAFYSILQHTAAETFHLIGQFSFTWFIVTFSPWYISGAIATAQCQRWSCTFMFSENFLINPCS